MRSVHVHPCNIFLFWLDLVQGGARRQNAVLFAHPRTTLNEGPHAKIYQTTKRKKNIYIIDLLNAFQVYLDDWIWPIISLPRKYKGGHPTKEIQKKLWFSEVFGTFGENCCFLEWVGILSQQGGSLKFLVKIVVFRNKLGFCPNPPCGFSSKTF